jgi:hypothetical protein
VRVAKVMQADLRRRGLAKCLAAAGLRLLERARDALRVQVSALKQLTARGFCLHMSQVQHANTASAAVMK